MRKIKNAFSKQPLIVILIAMMVGISLGEFSNVHYIQKSADESYRLTIESVAKLENIPEKKDYLELKDSDVYYNNEKLELSPESQMIVINYSSFRSKNAAYMIAVMTIGFDFIVFMFFAVVCDWIYKEDQIESKNRRIRVLSTQNRAMLGALVAGIEFFDKYFPSRSKSDSKPSPANDSAPRE